MYRVRRALKAKQDSHRYHQAVMIPELLLLYFSEIPEKELLVLALSIRANLQFPELIGPSGSFVSENQLWKQDPPTSRDVHPDDWSYFQNAAQKIIHLRLSALPDQVFTDRLLQEEAKSPQNPIFSQLKSLYLIIDSFFGVEWSPVLALILTPTIDTLDVIGTIDDTELLDDVLLQVTSATKSIHSLGISGPSFPLLLQPPFIEFQQLTILRLHHFSPGVLYEMGHLPNLTLSFDGNNTTPYLHAYILIDVVMPRLRTLVLRPYLEWEYDDPDGIQLLEERSPLLERVDVGLGPGPGPNVWSLASLTTCLAQLTQLREIKIETHKSRTVLCNHHVVWFVEYLPLLESLVLVPRDAEDPLTFTGKALMDITAFPMVLKHLDIPLNLSTIGQAYPTPLPPPEHKTTSTLRFIHAKPFILSRKHVEEAASFLGGGARM
ncbi:hypothetical protein FRB94_010511 [Tulasnella sp. JGI-2019a]|nr:hypothetical protein FRB94_010511 [Tulasnella sp. JGI-2019a]